MAGSGFKTFAVSEVLTAADTNGYLMQGILVFATSSARTTALGSPTEGQASLLKDSNTFEIYDGSAWVALLDTDTFSVDGSGNYTTTTDMTVGGGDLRLGTTAAGETLNVVGITTTSGAGSNLVVAGGDATGTNQAGAYLALQPGMGTGNVGSGDIRLQTGPAGASGTTTNSTTTVMTVTADSAVGIGETAPASDLVVRADSAGGRGGEVSIINYAAATVGSEAALNFALENSTYAADLGNCQIKGYLANTNGESDMVFSCFDGSAFAERMRLTGPGTHTADLFLGQSSTYSLAGSSDGNTFVNSASGKATYFRINNATEAVLNGTGLSIGRGDSGPDTAALHIEDTGVAIRMSRTGYDAYGFEHSSGAGIAFKNITDSRNEMYFNGGGGVGIATLVPYEQLDVNGNIAWNNELTAQPLETGNGIGYINFHGYLGGNTQYRDLGVYNGREGLIAYFDGSAQALGLGTTTPAGVLDLGTTGGRKLYTYNAGGSNVAGIGVDGSGGPYEMSIFFSSSGKLTVGPFDGTSFHTKQIYLANGAALFGCNSGFTSNMDGTTSGVEAGPGLCIGDRSLPTTAANRWVFYTTSSGSGISDAHMYYGGGSDSAGHKLDINGDGSTDNITGVWGTISGRSVKQDITDAASQVDDIKAIRFVNYRLIQEVEDQGDDARRMLGVIAEELEDAGMGGLVRDGRDYDGEPTKSVKQSIMLVKGLKALQEIIGRVEALESASA